jgi:murein DD-endopeptidase MepM/ murein hydrolase activator NlpD
VLARKQKARSINKKAARSVTTEENDDEEEEQHDGYPAGQAMNGQPNAAAYAGYAAAASSPFAYQQQPQQQQPQQQPSSDLYQTAYAQAYAQLQAQFQSAYPAAVPQPYGQAPPMPAFPAQSSYYPSPPPMPSMPTPFPGMPGATAPFPGSMPSAATADDGLANVLMAWYQSGYYTGRFQAMQEMKTRGPR